jgi:hypothetical protein
MFCPRCGCEYEDHIRLCSDCGVALVKTLPPENREEETGVQFVPLPNLPGRVYAEMVKGVLEKEGIPCYLRGEGVTDALQSPGTLPLGGVQLFVPEDRLGECIEIQHQMLDHI